MHTFIEKILSGALAGYKQYNILPSLTLAQAILESNWGKSKLTIEANNLFGIKADARWTGKKVKYETKECLNGKWTTVQAFFRAYDSYSESIEDHTRFLLTNRYEKVRTFKDYKEACTEIWKAGYATDPKYPQKLIDIIEIYKLYQYDRKENANMIMGTPPVLIRSVDRLNHKVKIMALLLVKKCADAGVPIIITQTYRTAETQKEYYSWGRKKLNPFKKNMTKVTKLDGVKDISRHQTGLAFDVCINKPGDLYNPVLLAKVGKIGMSLGLTWGGSWKSFPDPPHFEIPPSRIDNFKITEEDDDMPRIEVSEKEKGYGIAAIKRLAELKYISNPDVHIRNLETDPSAWAQWVVQVKLAEKLEVK